MTSWDKTVRKVIRAYTGRSFDARKVADRYGLSTSQVGAIITNYNLGRYNF